MSSPSTQGLPRDSKLTKACNRCHEKKIKCDGSIPICRPCQKSKAEDCNVTEGVLFSYAKVLDCETRIDALQRRVAWLEDIVGKHHVGNIRDIATGTELDVGGGRGGASVLAVGRSQDTNLTEELGLLSLKGCGSYIGSMAGITLGALVAATLRLYQEDLPPMEDSDIHNGTSKLARASVLHAGLPSKSVAAQHILAYLEDIHPWYPCLSLAQMAEDLDILYNRPDATLPPQRAAYRSEEYFTTAMSFFPMIASTPSLETVQAIILICVYGMRSYDISSRYSIDLWQLVGFGIRMAIQLGLTRSNWKWDFNEEEKEQRRRTWWCMYGLERVVATSTGRVLAIRNEDAHLPRVLMDHMPIGLKDILGVQLGPIDLSPGVHLISQRRLLGDVMECVYIARPRDRPSLSIEETSLRVYRIQSELIKWQQDSLALAHQDSIPGHVLQLALHHATLVLHRPSPSFPTPPVEVLEVCLVAARGVIRTFEHAIKNDLVGKIIPGWSNFVALFMAGLTLVYCSWTGSLGPSAVLPSTTHPFDRDLLSSLNSINYLTRTYSLNPRYERLYRSIVESFARILSISPYDLLPDLSPSTATQADNSNPFMGVAVDAGLDNGLWSDLELDQESVELITRLLASGNAPAGNAMHF